MNEFDEWVPFTEDLPQREAGYKHLSCEVMLLTKSHKAKRGFVRMDDDGTYQCYTVQPLREIKAIAWKSL